MLKLPRRQFLHLAAGAAALPVVPRIARGQTYPTERHPLRAGRFVLHIEPGDAKEHQRSVGAAHLLGLLGIGLHPPFDPLHRDLLARNQLALNEHAPDRLSSLQRICAPQPR
jgi:hypothetical protein